MTRYAIAGTLAACLLVGLGTGGGSAFGTEGADVPTYHRDVAPILQRHCQDCHRPGEVAPFSLLEYDHARRRASDLLLVVEERRMPPWPASKDFGGPFRDERILSDAEIDTLQRWLDADTPEGDPADAPEPLTFAGDWPMGEPDLILTMAEPYALGAEGDDEFRVFVLPTDLPEDRWIRAVDFKPGNRRVVHHVIAGTDTSGRARELDAEDETPGYSAVGGFGDGVPIRSFLPIWVPGSTPRDAPEDAGYLLPKGADVLIQVHYHKSGKVEEDATAIGLYFSDEPLGREVRTGFVFPDVSMFQAMKARAAMQEKGGRPGLNEFMREVLVIPPGEANYEVKGSTRQGGVMGRPLGRDVLLTAVMPHMHWLGKDFTLTAVLPDETRVPIIRIDRWDFNWQGTYALLEPVFLPEGTWFEMVAHFDNSAENPNNPSHPPVLVRWGDQTNDEMCIGIFEFVPATDADRARSVSRDPSGDAAD
ncbi:ascorbate-dependent monooxygenase [Tautonia marina]|uniref:ascorbate-dependent monooxygenase n=1 Tax=Tautonia marina TaxID=2653855 RepID=UPI00126061C2|nr:ascorbate-dependent monooxygenase [Tautonia marina]